MLNKFNHIERICNLLYLRYLNIQKSMSSSMLNFHSNQFN